MTPKMNQFQTFELTPEEQLLSFQLSTLQLAHLHNIRTETVSAMLALEFDPAEPLEYMRQKVYKQGQVDILTYIIDCAESATNPVTKPEE